MQLRDAGVEESRIEVVYDGVAVPPRRAAATRFWSLIRSIRKRAWRWRKKPRARAGVEERNHEQSGADLPRARALVYLTHSEGLGSGILLAMAHGVTVIASNVGGIPELIRDGENGILVKNDPPRRCAGAFAANRSRARARGARDGDRALHRRAHG